MEAKIEPKIPEEAEANEDEDAEEEADDESFEPKRSEAKDEDDPPVDEQPVRFSPSISLSVYLSCMYKTCG